MRLVFFYHSQGAAAPGQIEKWEPRSVSKSQWARQFPTEGYYRMLEKLLEKGIVSEVVVIIESNVKPGRFHFAQNFYGYVIPHISFAQKFIKPKDILFVRGGFKSWLPHLKEYQDNGHWLMLYAANTGREKWPHWDIILDDLSDIKAFDKEGRLRWDFKKVTNDKIFGFKEGLDRDYDVCIGASHIHEKKGQIKVLRALRAYKSLYKHEPVSVLPGSMRYGKERGKEFLSELSKLSKVDTIGMVPRPQMAYIYNRSKIFVKAGGGGQNDRGVLEAMICGCPVALAAPHRSAPFVSKTPLNYVIEHPDDPEYLAKIIRVAIMNHSESNRYLVRNYYQSYGGLCTHTIPDFERIFNFFRRTRIQNKEELKKFAKEEGVAV